MIRVALSLSILLGAALVACNVGTAAIAHNGPDGGGGGGGDGGGGGGGGGGGDAPLGALPQNHCAGGVVDQAVGCLSLTNKSNAGQDCGQSGCHATGGGGESFEFMGTVCSSDSSTTCAKPAQAITVTFGTATATTDQDGNFYVAGTPITGTSSSTEGGNVMSTTPTYDCNSSACHMALSTETYPAGGSGLGQGTIYNSP